MENYKKAKDIASDRLFYIDGLASAREAAEMMQINKTNVLFIKKRNIADANGIITAADIVKGVYIFGKTLDEVSIYEIMTKPVFSIPARLNVKYIPRLMNNHHIRVAPVEENGEFIGVIDFAQFLYMSLDE